MTAFVVGVVLLLLLALGMMWAPFVLRRRPQSALDTRAENIAIHRERLAELEAQLTAGDLEPAAAQRMRTEMQRSLLEDASDGLPATAATGMRGGWPLALLLTLSVPLASWLLYDHLGAARDWLLGERITAVTAAQTPETRLRELDLLARDLHEKLSRDADHVEARYLLARTLMELGRYPEALPHYALLVASEPQEVRLLTEYAQARFVAADRVLGPETADILRQVLEIDPHNLMALGMLGLGAFGHQDYAAAERYWRRALQLTRDEAGRAALARGIAQARERMGLPPEQPSGPVIQVRVELDAALQAGLTGDEPVFVFARDPDGPPLPLAAVRLRVADLPIDVRLDDSRAMTPAAKLSDAAAVQVRARVSRSGQPTPQSGDLQSAAVHVIVQDPSPGITLKIAEILP